MSPHPAGADGVSFCGVVFEGGDRAVSHVPLQKSVISAVVIDVSCRVTITQTYQNESDSPTPRARYVFPVPSRAAICAFSMMTADGHLIYALAKDKIEATKDFEEAVGEGKAAALQEKVSGDIFRMSLGSIPARGKFKTKTVFVMDLMNYDYLCNKVQLSLPLALGKRYGALPEQLKEAAGHIGRVKLKITVEIQMSGRILSVDSPSHQNRVFLEDYVTHYGRSSRRRVTAQFNSTTFLDRDFELVIQANELERSRCFAETNPRHPGTIALQLMVIPHFQLPPIPEQEYILLIDRSGSMSGGRLDMAKQCVSLLLRCLPGGNTVFNIFHFDDSHGNLWPQSRPYDNKNVQEATAYVNALYASGGTRLSTAMGAFLGSRRTSMPTAAFILTDGEVFSGEAQTACNIVQNSVRSSPPGAPLRLFILGIGDTVSSDVCEKLATDGRGQYLLAVSKETILLKCTSLLQAGRTSTITNVSVNWTVDISPPQPLVQKSPPELSIPEMYPSDRSLFFAIVHAKTAPKQVVIRGKVDGKDESICVDVESVKFGRRFTEPLFIHTLAANRLIRDLEDGNAGGRLSQTARREEIVKLGEYYQLASSHTSFVAVDHGEVHLPPQVQQQSPTIFTSVASLVGTIWQYLTDPTALFKSSVPAGSSRRRQNDEIPGGWSPSESAGSQVPSDTDADTEYSDNSEDNDDWASDNTFSTLSSLESHSSVDIRPARRARRPDSTHPRRPLSPQAPYSPPPASLTTSRFERFKPLPISPGVVTLVQQMSTSGSFALTDVLGAIVGMEALEEARSWEDEELAATALAMAYLEGSLGDYLDVLKLLMEKGLEFVKNQPNGPKFGEMLDRARMILQRE